jgi:hypothetical protein
MPGIRQKNCGKNKRAEQIIAGFDKYSARCVKLRTSLKRYRIMTANWSEFNNKLQKLAATGDERLISLFNTILSADGNLDETQEGPISYIQGLMFFQNTWGLSDQKLKEAIKKLEELGIIIKDAKGIGLNLPGLKELGESKDNLIAERIAIPFINGTGKTWFEKVIEDINSTPHGGEYLHLLAKNGHIMREDKFYQIDEAIRLNHLDMLELKDKFWKSGIILIKYKTGRDETIFMSRAVIDYVNKSGNQTN